MIRVVACLHGLLAETGGSIVAGTKAGRWYEALAFRIDIVTFYLRVLVGESCKNEISLGNCARSSQKLLLVSKLTKRNTTS